MAEWTVALYNQDGSDDPNRKELVAVVRPENLHFVFQQGVLGPHELEFELSLGAEDLDGNRVVSHSFIGPYRTDFQLRRSDLVNPLITGMITSYGGANAGDEHVKVAGKSYLHYLERRSWPYDPVLSYTNWPDGFRFKVAQAEVAQIVKDVLETVRDLSPNYPGPPDGGFPSYSLDFTVDVDSTGTFVNYEISPFESQSVYELVKTFAEQEKEQGGFDFYMTWDKIFRLAYPEVGNPDNPALFLEVDLETQLANMLEAGMTNTGPEATHVLGVGAGTATRQGGVNRHFRGSSARFRRLDKVADFGDVKNLAKLISLTGGDLQHSSNPIHEIPITVDPNQIPGFWTKVRPPGQYINVEYDLGFVRLESETSVKKINSIDCTVDLEGNESASLAVEQHYDGINPERAGLADW